jgi:hypothetical protein
MAFVWVYFALLMIRFTSSDTPHLQALLTPGNLQNLQMSSKYRWERWLLSVHPLAAPEVLPLIVVLLCIFNRPGIPFWSSSVFLLGSIYVILRLLVYLDTDHARAMRQSVLSFLFYLIGATILLVLVMRLPLSDIREVISLVGPEAVWLIFFPAVWAVPYAMTLTVLLDNRISFRDALYTQVSGDGFNGITPLLGMGGEPYKARHLSRFVPLQDSSRAIVQSRLIHALSGVLYTVIILLICLLIVDLSRLPALKAALLIITLVMILVTTFILWVTMSRAPSHFTGYVLSKFRLIEEFRHDPLSWSKLSLATLYRLIGRFGRFLELYLIFLVLEIVPSFADVVIVQGMVMASVSIFFFVPQGLGVNEAGIVTALDIAGYSAATGVVFGLIRRARMIVYTLMGLIVYVIGTALYARKKP